jgi:hypothetical protein
MPKGSLTDLDNAVAPPGSTLVTITASAFITWMTACRYEKGAESVFQEVFFIKKFTPIRLGEDVQYTPNWHITAMLVYRSGGDCRNFHFKVEMGKSASHYWHYVIHEHNGNFIWVGDPSPLIPATNEGGGGAGANALLLAQNRESTQTAARGHQLDGLVTKSTQLQMMRTLKRLTSNSILHYDAGRVE